MPTNLEIDDVTGIFLSPTLTVLKDYGNQMPVIRSGDADAIISMIDGGMSVNRYFNNMQHNKKMDGISCIICICV